MVKKEKWADQRKEGDKMKKAIIFSLFFVFLILIPLVSASNSNFQREGNGIIVNYKDQISIKQNQYYDLHIHAFNDTVGGSVLTDVTTSCTLHLYNSTGNHILIQDMSYSTADFRINILAGNFSKTGHYVYTVGCINDDGWGFISGHFEVTPTGESNAFGFQIFLFILFFGLVILGFMVKNEWIVILGGLGLIIIGIFSLTEGISNFKGQLTNLISLVTIGFGAIVSIGTAIEVISDGM